MEKSTEILILGAGCFGLSTAYHLLQRGYQNITIVDRANQLPAPDAASTDLNKVVRSAYGDIVFSRLAREAIVEWKLGDWDDAYHEYVPTQSRLLYSYSDGLPWFLFVYSVR